MSLARRTAATPTRSPTFRSSMSTLRRRVAALHGGDRVYGRPSHRVGRGGGPTAAPMRARASGDGDGACRRGNPLLSAGRDGQVREWRWRSGACLRELLLNPSPVPFTAMSYHAATSSFALGNAHGEMCVFRRNPRNDDREPACYPLTSWALFARGSHNEVASIQHDGDKVVFSTRAEILRIAWLGSMPDEGMPIGMYRTGKLVRSTPLLQEPSPASFTPRLWLKRAHVRLKRRVPRQHPRGRRLRQSGARHTVWR